VKSKGDALQAYRDLKQRDFWMGEILSGQGRSLALAGRLDDSAKGLNEALALARELQNAGLIAQVLRFQAERLFYAGDVRGAAKLAEQAAQAAARSQDRTLDILAQAEAARVSAALQPSRAAAATLAKIGRQAEVAGLTYLSLHCALEGAYALLQTGAHGEALQQAQTVNARAESLELRELVVKSGYVIATAMRLTKDPQARRHYASSLQFIDEMRREEGSQTLLDRADLKAIHAECVRWSQAS
jgi:hypothetical protein